MTAGMRRLLVACVAASVLIQGRAVRGRVFEVLSGRTDVRTAVGALMVRRQRAESEPVSPGRHVN